MICYNCGKTFPAEDVVKQRDPETGLHIWCCPHCGQDDVDEGEICKICGKEFCEGETHAGFCVNCLWDEIDYDVTLAYIKENKMLAEFMIEYIWNAGAIKYSSSDLDEHLEETFRRMVANDKLSAAWGGKADFLEQCKFFCLPDYLDHSFGHGGSDFADWYEEYMGRKEATK